MTRLSYDAITRASEEMASWVGQVPTGVDGFRPFAERVLLAAGSDLTQHSAGELAAALAHLSLGFFGSVNATGEDRDRLTSSLIQHAVEWSNEHFELGLPPGTPKTVSDDDITSVLLDALSWMEPETAARFQAEESYKRVKAALAA